MLGPCKGVLSRTIEASPLGLIDQYTISNCPVWTGVRAWDEISEVAQLQVTIATNCRALSRCRNVSSTLLPNCFHTGFLVGVFFYLKYGSGLILRNVGWLSTDYTVLYPRRYNFITTDVKTWNPTSNTRSRSLMSPYSSVSVHRVYSVSTHNILTSICEVWYTVWSGRCTVDYLCVLFVGDGIKRRPRCTVRKHAREGRSTGETGDVKRWDSPLNSLSGCFASLRNEKKIRK
jgi:hypothetical protein